MISFARPLVTSPYLITPLISRDRRVAGCGLPNNSPRAARRDVLGLRVARRNLGQLVAGVSLLRAQPSKWAWVRAAVALFSCWCRSPAARSWGGRLSQANRPPPTATYRWDFVHCSCSGTLVDEIFEVDHAADFGGSRDTVRSHSAALVVLDRAPSSPAPSRVYHRIALFSRPCRPDRQCRCVPRNQFAPRIAHGGDGRVADNPLDLASCSIARRFAWPFHRCGTYAIVQLLAGSPMDCAAIKPPASPRSTFCR